jgi:hypothetical protein
MFGDVVVASASGRRNWEDVALSRKSNAREYPGSPQTLPSTAANRAAGSRLRIRLRSFSHISPDLPAITLFSTESDGS